MLALLDHIVAGGSLQSFCRPREFSYNTFKRWIEASPARVAMYAGAREDRSDWQAESLAELSRRDCSTPVFDSEGREVGRKVDPAAVQQLKLEIDSLKWIASKMKPKVYADRLDVNATMDVRSAPAEALAKELAGLGMAGVAQALQQAYKPPADGE